MSDRSRYREKVLISLGEGLIDHFEESPGIYARNIGEATREHPKGKVNDIAANSQSSKVQPETSAWTIWRR